MVSSVEGFTWRRRVHNDIGNDLGPGPVPRTEGKKRSKCNRPRFVIELNHGGKDEDE
jgi:hypothetical protein